jgi:hypothetical protein
LIQARGKIDEAKALLTPYLLALTPAKRWEPPKIGEKTIGFLEKAYDFVRKSPSLIPSYLDLAAFGADFADTHGLGCCLTQFREGLSGLCRVNSVQRGIIGSLSRINSARKGIIEALDRINSVQKGIIVAWRSDIDSSRQDRVAGGMARRILEKA